MNVINHKSKKSRFLKYVLVPRASCFSFFAFINLLCANFQISSLKIFVKCRSDNITTKHASDQLRRKDPSADPVMPAMICHVELTPGRSVPPLLSSLPARGLKIGLAVTLTKAMMRHAAVIDLLIWLKMDEMGEANTDILEQNPGLNPALPEHMVMHARNVQKRWFRWFKK